MFNLFSKKEEGSHDFNEVVMQRCDMEALQQVIQRILQEKDLTARFAVNPGCPLEPFVNQLNQVLDLFTDTMEDTCRALNHVVHGAISMDSVVLMAQRSQETVGQVDQVIAVNTELSSSVAEVAVNVASASNDATEAGHLAHEGKGQVEKTIGEMRDISDSINTLSKEMEALGEEVKEIETIVGLINSIADQTNLLALNAAIEAARAGEQGRGFGVVAGEVRNLAEQTKSSAKEITDKISRIQNETQYKIKRIHTLTAMADQSNETSTQTMGVLEQVNAKVDATVRAIGEIAPVTEEQSAAFTDLTEKMAIILETSKTTINEASKAKESLAEIGFTAEKIRNDVARFKLRLKDYDIIELAKTDHMLWKWRISNMFYGSLTLRSEDVRDHTICRLGKWYGNHLAKYGRHRSFQALEGPHSRFHQVCAELIGEYNRGNKAKAQDLMEQVEGLSYEVLQLLTDLQGELAGSES